MDVRDTCFEVEAPDINLTRLDLVSMRLVLACARQHHGSISAAAPACNMSVMGASERLRRLEEALGQPLFRRVRQGLTATEAGEAAVRAAERIFGIVQEMMLDVRAAQPAAPDENCGRRGKSAQLRS